MYVIVWAQGRIQGGEISLKESKDRSMLRLEQSSNADGGLGPFTTLVYEVASIATIGLKYVVPKKGAEDPSEGSYHVLTSPWSYLQSSKFNKEQLTKHLRLIGVKL